MGDNIIFILRAKKYAKFRVYNMRISYLAPTFLEIAGLEDSTLDGLSLLNRSDFHSIINLGLCYSCLLLVKPEK